jgi:hypothetical protein
MKKLLLISITLLLIFVSEYSYSQSESKLPSYYRKELNVDSLVRNTPGGLIFHPQITVYPKKVFASAKQQSQYEKLKRNFIKVYPVALEITALYSRIEDSLSKFPTDKERKKYLKMRESQIMDEYKPRLVKFTISQSVLLVKLLDRESGSTAYEIIDELKGSVKAFFWQGFAKIFGNDLKKEYDSAGKDKEIEQLVKQYKDGTLI